MSRELEIHRRLAGRLVRHASWMAIAVGAALSAGTAHAQDKTAAASADTGSSVLEEIMVTGSRIQRTGMNTPTPVTTLDLGELSDMAPGNLIESMSQLPQFYNNTTTNNANSFFNSPGAGSLNLRGLGTNRTLVLLDGRRMPSSSKEGVVDINIIPSEMIKRVDTVTGGASAAYGTDAVSGVVNFILDTDYEGISGHIQGGVSQRGDNQNWEASGAFGQKIGNRGHLLLSMEASKANGIFSYEGRDWYQGWGTITNPMGGNPQRLIFPNVVSTSASYDGVLRTPTDYLGPLDFLQFNSDGSVSPFVRSANSSPLNPTTGAYSGLQSQSGGSGTNNGTDRPTLVPDSSRVNAFGYFKYDVTDNVQLFAQGIYSESHLRQTNLGGFFGQSITIFNDNAFLPQEVKTAMADNGIDHFSMGRVGYSSDLAQNAWTTMTNKTYAGTLGFDANVHTSGLFDGWNTNGYYQYGKVHANNYQWGGIRLDRIYLALDAVKDPATGSTVCHVTMVSGMYPDCVPLNLFGRGNASQEAIDWVTGMDPGEKISTNLYYGGQGLDTTRTDTYTSIDAKQYLATIIQHTAEWTASGEVWEGWGAGPISAAVGLSYRKESIDQIVRDSTNPTANNETYHPVPGNDAALGIRGVPGGDAGNTVGIQFSKVPNIRGSLNTKEAFGELLVPIFSSDSFLHQLNGDFAVRYADYSGSGGIWAWKAGLNADLDYGFRLRGTLSRDVRAATLSERFNQTGGSGFIEDPDNVIAGVKQSYNIFLVSGGNPEVSPEKSDSITVGAVWQPEFLDGLGFSVDYYRMKIKDALGTLTSQNIVDRCFDGATAFCDLVERVADASMPSGQRINVVHNVVVNIANAEVSGIDFEADYRSRINLFGGGAEMVSFRGFASYLIENSTSTPTSGGGVNYLDLAGQGTTPHWKANLSMNYTNGGFGLFVQERFIGGGNINNLWTTGVEIEDNSIPSVAYTDMRLSYTIDTEGGSIETFFNVTNLLDKDPPVVPSFANFGAAPAQTSPIIHDIIGRRFVAGVRFRY